MNDRELLELAAKAAGVKGHFIERTPEDGYPAYTCGIGSASIVLWNPLTDDGDALRLSIRLGISIYQNIVRVQANTIALALAGTFIHEDTLKQDYDVATRRAIVRAAAEIGKAMP